MSANEQKKGTEENPTHSKWQRLKSYWRRAEALTDAPKGEDKKPGLPPIAEDAPLQELGGIKPDNREKKGVSGSQKRQRMKGVRAAVTEAEYDALQERARNAGLSTAAYLRACALGDKGPRAKPAPPVNRALLGLTLAELKRVGNNLNQIAHHLNAGGHPENRHIADAHADLSACLQSILKALGKKE